MRSVALAESSYVDRLDADGGAAEKCDDDGQAAVEVEFAGEVDGNVEVDRASLGGWLADPHSSGWAWISGRSLMHIHMIGQKL